VGLPIYPPIPRLAAEVYAVIGGNDAEVYGVATPSTTFHALPPLADSTQSSWPFL
jgi:hypothetical protein